MSRVIGPFSRFNTADCNSPSSRRDGGQRLFPGQSDVGTTFVVVCPTNFVAFRESARNGSDANFSNDALKMPEKVPTPMLRPRGRRLAIGAVASDKSAQSSSTTNLSVSPLVQAPGSAGSSFPKLTFDKRGRIESPAWVNDLLTEEQRQLRGAAVVDVYGSKPGEINERWNRFMLGPWDPGDDSELYAQILQQNDPGLVIHKIRGH
jgi:hypothetical protein